MKFRVIALSSLLILSFLAEAHEFWLHPERFRLNAGETLAVSFKIGENFTGEPWKFRKQRVELLNLYGDDGYQQKLIDRIVDGDKENLKVTFERDGTHIIALQTNNAFIKTDGEKFNAYLKEDGLDEAYDFRLANNQLADSASELYSRYTKLLVQVGDKLSNTHLKELGFPIEIVPLENPYAVKVGDKIHFKVLYQGKPLFGARVKVMNRYNNRTLIQNIYTEKDGTMETTLSNRGLWMVHVVKMIPSKDKKAEWQSYWGNIVFGI
jgi:uncharacterized GH25 family protein